MSVFHALTSQFEALVGAALFLSDIYQQLA